MTEKLRRILDNLHKYNSVGMAKAIFGLEETEVYDALVVAPSYDPYKILQDGSFKVTELIQRNYTHGFLVEKDGLKIAWINTASGGCNLLDHVLVCGELQFKKLIFIGAVGALREGFDIGDVCTPTYSIAGTLANTYLKDSLYDYVPFERVYPDEAYVEQVVELAASSGYAIKNASVFCTDSIVMEYTHLDEIRAFGTDLIEMETATLYEVGKLMEVPTVALLVVSDNSATDVPLVGKSDELLERYHHSRNTVLPDMILKIARQA